MKRQKSLISIPLVVGILYNVYMGVRYGFLSFPYRISIQVSGIIACMTILYFHYAVWNSTTHTFSRTPSAWGANGLFISMLMILGLGIRIIQPMEPANWFLLELLSAGALVCVYILFMLSRPHKPE